MKEHELKMSLKKGHKNIENDVILKQEFTNIIMMNKQVKDIQ